MKTFASVLLVDDDPFARKYLKIILEKIGVRNINEAVNSLEATEVVGQEKTDLVFLDADSGLELLKQIRTGKAGTPRELPVIIMTMADNGQVLGTAMALDCNAQIKKPAAQNEIAAKMLDALQQKMQIRPVLAYEIIPLPVDDRTQDDPQQKEERKQGKRFSLPKVLRFNKATVSGTDEKKDSSNKKTVRKTRDRLKQQHVQNEMEPMMKQISVTPEGILDGDVLAENVYTEAGLLLLESGTALNGLYIERLLNVKQRIGLRRVKVHRLV